MKQGKYDVFISYSRKDYVDDNGNIIPNNIISKIKDTLTQNNISYWFDEDGIYSGDEFASILTQAIRNSGLFLYISSMNSNQSRWTSNEISTALVYKKTIIPFRIDDSPYNDSVMMKIVSFDYIEYKGDEKSIKKLILAIKHHLQTTDKGEKICTKQVEQAEWDKVNKSDFDELIKFAKLFPSGKYSIYADECIWKLIIANPTLDTFEKYRKEMPAGIHIRQAIDTLNIYSEWQRINKLNDIFAVKKFIDRNHSYHLIEEAHDFFQNMKDKEIEKIKKLPYSNFDRLEELIQANILSSNDIMDIDIGDLKKRYEWDKIRQAGDIHEVKRFLESNPNCSFIADVQTFYNQTKGNLLKQIKEDMDSYTYDDLCKAVQGGIFSYKELVEDGLMTKDCFNKISDFKIDDFDYSRTCLKESSEEDTDIFFWGLPTCGKTCLLMSLVGENGNGYYLDMTGDGGMYAAHLSYHLHNGIAPQSTAASFKTLIHGKIKANQQKRRNKFYNVNFVEMSGEEYYDLTMDNPENPTSLESRIDSQFLKLLNNNNSKIFFIIIDPTQDILKWNRLDYFYDDGQLHTASVAKYMSQDIIHKKFLSLLMQPDNAKMMTTVKAIHIIITKADKLGDTQEERDRKAKEIIEQKYKALLLAISDCCKHYKINNDSQNITLSLGKFCWHRIFDYDTNNTKLINIIQNDITSEKGGLFCKLWMMSKSIVSQNEI